MPPSETAPATETPAQEADKAPAAPAVNYSMSGGFPRLLARLDVSLGFTSYQSGKLYLLGRNPKGGGLMVDERLFPKAMGLYAEGHTLALATLFQIQRFENVLDAGQAINHTQDACYVPRITYTTGILDAHDIGMMEDGRIVFVNTAYNCLAVPSHEDRCHLNGLAMENGKPRYVTAVSRSDTIDGWRDRRAEGGVVIDVETGEIVCSGLSMPHSPRLVDGRLWLLNSGTGELGEVDLATKTFRPFMFCPGFGRGLAIRGRHAFVGLSKPRYKRFEGLALDERLKAADSEPWCGIQVIDLDKKTCVEWFRIDGAVAEIYDVAVLPGIACPMSLGFASNEIRNLITHDPLTPQI